MKHWKELKRHPISAQYPDLPYWQRQEMKEGLQKHGLVNRTIILKDGMILDGWQLHSVCVELDIKPAYKELDEDWDPEEFVELQNNFRRHETEARVKERLKERRERVAQARSDGKSTREIAEEEGVDQKTVRKDIKAYQENEPSGEDPSSPEGGISNVSEGSDPKSEGSDPKKVTGRDGKTYAAEKPKILCPRCSRAERIGQPVPKNCEMCKELRPAAPKKPKVEEDEKEIPLDDFRNELPKSCRAAYKDPWIRSAIDFLAVMDTKFRNERLADGLLKRAKHLPFVNAKDFVDGVGMAMNTIDDLLNHLKDNRPAGVCPSCSGAGCAACKMNGLVTRELYSKLKAKKK